LSDKVVTEKKVGCPLERKRGRLTLLPERQKYVQWINEAIDAGAKNKSACEVAEISIRTLQRWCVDERK